MHRDSCLIKSRDPPFQSAPQEKKSPLYLPILIVVGKTAFLARISPIKAEISHQIAAVSIYQNKCQTSGEESGVRLA